MWLSAPAVEHALLQRLTWRAPCGEMRRSPGYNRDVRRAVIQDFAVATSLPGTRATCSKDTRPFTPTQTQHPPYSINYPLHDPAGLFADTALPLSSPTLRQVSCKNLAPQWQHTDRPGLFVVLCQILDPPLEMTAPCA